MRITWLEAEEKGGGEGGGNSSSRFMGLNRRPTPVLEGPLLATTLRNGIGDMSRCLTKNIKLQKLIDKQIDKTGHMD